MISAQNAFDQVAKNKKRSCENIIKVPTSQGHDLKRITNCQ